MTACRNLACLALSIAWLGSLPALTAGQPSDVSAASEPVALATKDGVQLHATYFPSGALKGSPQAKQATPVILLHDYKGTGAALAPLAGALQGSAEPGGTRPFFASIAVDLRGHGGSTRVLSPLGDTMELDAAKLGKEGLYAMAHLDMEAVRSYLVDKNDDGELNLNKLCIVGSGMGASVAVNWALQDWTAPPLAVGKQGQDVKGLVLVSPRWSYSGLSMQEAMKFSPLKQNVAWMLFCGAQEQKFKSDLSRIHKQLERLHPETDKTGAKRNSGLVVSEKPSKLQGDVLLQETGGSTESEIVKFLTDNVAIHSYPWTNRRGKIP